MCVQEERLADLRLGFHNIVSFVCPSWASFFFPFFNSLVRASRPETYTRTFARKANTFFFVEFVFFFSSPLFPQGNKKKPSWQGGGQRREPQREKKVCKRHAACRREVPTASNEVNLLPKTILMRWAFSARTRRDGRYNIPQARLLHVCIYGSPECATPAPSILSTSAVT